MEGAAWERVETEMMFTDMCPMRKDDASRLWNYSRASYGPQREDPVDPGPARAGEGWLQPSNSSPRKSV